MAGPTQNGADAADSESKGWTDLQKFETLLYMFDKIVEDKEGNKTIDWKKVGALPYGRNINTVGKMIKRERARIEKQKTEGQATNADDTASENNTAETKSASGKKTSAKGGSSNGKRKMPGEANTKSSVKRVKEEA